MDWQYRENPAGPARTWLAKAGTKIAGTCSATPYRVRVKGKIKTGWRMQDLLVEPDYRGLGIHHTFSRLSHEFLMKSKYPFNFAFPNERSYPGFVRTGWQAVFRIPLWIRANLNGVQGKTNAVAIISFDKNTDRIWKAYVNRIDYAVERSADYLNWRYLKNPKSKYFPYVLEEGKDKLVLIMKYYDREDGNRLAHICDLFQSAPNKKLSQMAFNFALEFAVSHHCQAISGWFTRAGSLKGLLEDHEFVLQKELPRWFVINSNVPGNFTKESRWHLSMGDSDVY